MKRFYVFLTALAALLFLSCASLAEKGSLDGISPRILKLLADRGLENCAEDYIRLSWVEAPKGVFQDHTFVLVSKDGIHHEVYHYTNDQTDENADQGWNFKTYYDCLAPQGKGVVAFQRHDANDRTGSDISLYKDDQGFLIYRIDPDNEEYWMQAISIHVIKYQFQVVSWFDRSNVSSTEAYIRNGKIEFYDWSAEKKRGNVNLYTVFGLNTDFRSLPKSYQEAKETFSDPPVIPTGTGSNSLPNPQRIKFTADKKYEVYSGPGKQYLRSANGKASMSTNDWVQVFGKESGWIMVQYDITSDHMRIGWIPEKALPKKSNVDTIEFIYSDTTIISDANLTDDPLFSESVLCTIPAGNTVQYLASMGDWVYIEWNGTSQPVRGFIKENCLTNMTKSQAKAAAIEILLATNPVAEQQSVTREMLESYSVTFDFDPMTSQWTIGFDSGRDYRYTVVVNDQTGNGWVGSENG